ncbi:MAG: DinB family protein [Thermoanaerobaculia bacterium]|nr:DinB family protein [Thermoanaerobaculia bacterium]
MALTEALANEMQQENRVTRTLLEIVPADRADWKPHEKSFSMGQLASHIVNLQGWVLLTLENSEFDMHPPGQEPAKSPGFDTVNALLERFDSSVAAGQEALAKGTDADLFVDWTLKNSGKTIFTAPKAGVLRSFVLNHTIHHRGQLSVYLRLCDVPLPMIYGPTADTGWK